MTAIDGRVWRCGGVAGIAGAGPSKTGAMADLKVCFPDKIALNTAKGLARFALPAEARDG